MAILAQKVLWRGIYFAPGNSYEGHGNSSLENVDIENAFDGIKAKKAAPALLGISLKNCAYGVQVQELAKPMEIIDSTILSSRMMGVNIENSFGKVIMHNATIVNTRSGDGFVYTRTAVDLCSVFPRKIYFPLLVNAVAKVSMTRCSQVRTETWDSYEFSDFYIQLAIFLFVWYIVLISMFDHSCLSSPSRDTYFKSAFPLVKLDTVCITICKGLRVNLTCYLGYNLILASDL